VSLSYEIAEYDHRSKPGRNGHQSPRHGNVRFKSLGLLG
jgi:hypothetical protein